MRDSKYRIGCPYYRIALMFELGMEVRCNSGEQHDPTVVIDTWFYQGYFKLDANATDCDIPHHFYVFQPCVPTGDPLLRPPERGLKIPTLRGVELAMLTLDELFLEVAEIKKHGGRP